MSKQPLSLRKKLVFSAISTLLLLIITVAVGEVLMQLKSTENQPKPPYDTAEKDDYLGWKMKPDYTWSGEMLDANQQPYNINIHFDKNGFKAFGDITAPPRKKVLFLGDSFTASIEASNENTFYNILADSLGFEAFAYGHAGYSTLQEYMVLDKWVDRIQPDVVVWETCSNDFIDNYAPLEIVCGYKVGMRRPYLNRDGRIFYQIPKSWWQRLVFLSWLKNRWDGVKQNLFKQEIQVGEYYIATEKRNFPPYDESVKRTEQIVAMIRKRLPEKTKLLGFSADIEEPQGSEFKRIFVTNGASFSQAPARLLEDTQLETKIALKSVDNCHWNEKGQVVIAKALMPHLREALTKN